MLGERIARKAWKFGHDIRIMRCTGAMRPDLRRCDEKRPCIFSYFNKICPDNDVLRGNNVDAVGE